MSASSLWTTRSSSGVLLVACVAFLAALCSMTQAQSPEAGQPNSDLPPPPPKPERFTSKQQLKEYLVKLHEYYAIIGRPRFGRSSPFGLPAAQQQQQQQQLHSAVHGGSSKQHLFGGGANKQQRMSPFVYSSAANDNDAMEDTVVHVASRSSSGVDLSQAAIPTNLILEILDQNNDGTTSKEELSNFLKIFHQKM